MIYDDYFEYTDKYKKKYGDKTVIFMQVGDFFEIYAVVSDSDKAGPDIHKICDLCNIVVSRKNKNIDDINRNNPLMAGFPLSAVYKFIQILVQHGYTIVLIRQTTPAPNPKREVTEIISPSMYMENSNTDGNFLMTMVWETYNNLKNVGISCIDITTGKSCTYEAYSRKEDINYAFDEAIRFIQCYQPREILLLGSLYDKDIANYFETLKHITIHHKWGEAFDKVFNQTTYQNSILAKAFNIKSLITPIEYIGLERFPLSATSYCCMIQFAYEHNETIISHIEIPKIWKNNKHLILESNSVHQLNVTSQSNNETPLMGYLNRCITSFGGRLFKERLLNPLNNAYDLNKLYDKIEKYRHDKLYVTIHKHLTNVIDLERILRKISLATLQPIEWSGINDSMNNCNDIFKLLNMDLLYNDNKEIIEYYNSILDIDKCNLNDMNTSIFKKNIYQDIDELDLAIETDKHYLQGICTKISEIGENDNTLCKLDYNDKVGYFFTITKKRWDNVKKTTNQLQIDYKTFIKVSDFTVKPISSTSSNLRITGKDIDKVSNRIISNQYKLSSLSSRYYKTVLLELYDKYNSKWNTIIKEIADIDVIATNAKNSIEYNYKRPNIVSSDNSYVKFKDIRHPIIERLNISTNYVTNDIDIGVDKKGILLYGINSSGKSSLMKAVGLNVIMAQSGMFVAASNIELAPYSHIFTRITNVDNIYRGHSTFTAEILELTNIFNRCDKNSLILGDELCSGTESLSATAIVAAGIDYILKRSSNFIFATHLHELTDVSLLKEHTDINVMHMHIEIDNKTNKIIYDRKLKPGNGSKIYGLEVCRAMNLPFDFITVANSVRNELQGNDKYIVTPKISKYNSELYVSNCQLCGNKATETHHIKHRKDADEQGFIDNIHEHDKSNLIVLCEECHLKQHHSELVVEGYIQTNEGIEIKTRLNVKKEEEYNPRDNLIYTTKGWKYKLLKKKKWTLIDHKNYEEFYMNCKNKINWIPSNKLEFDEVAVDYQSEFLEL
jgi:DNA mismatch repair protein MutS